MSKHTPGPWSPDKEGRVWRRPLSDLYEYGGTVAGDKPLATVHKGWYDEDQQGYPVNANTHLIAAAPDLLEACKDLLNALPSATTHPAIKAARAAIAKAKGEHTDE